VSRPAGIVGATPPAAQARGRLAEELAARHLAARGLRVIERNVRCRGGEVDLICLDRGAVVFIEVRLRTSVRFGSAAESITAAKRRRILLAAQWWLGGRGRRYACAACRFDVVLLDQLDDAGLTWLRGAFDSD
jgi:putative endonuclease